MEEEIRASNLKVGDVVIEEGGGDDEKITIAQLDQHGDTMLVTTSEGYDRSFDIDESLLRVGHDESTFPAGPRESGVYNPAEEEVPAPDTHDLFCFALAIARVKDDHCDHCGRQIENDDGTWFHPDTMSARCDGPDDEAGLSWGDMVRQAEPKTSSEGAAVTAEQLHTVLRDAGIHVIQLEPQPDATVPEEWR